MSTQKTFEFPGATIQDIQAMLSGVLGAAGQIHADTLYLPDSIIRTVGDGIFEEESRYPNCRPTAVAQLPKG